MELKVLQQKIDAADAQYYSTGQSLLDDAVYDSLKAELQKVNPTDIRLTRVGTDVRSSIFEKRKHSIAMGSLDKAMNETEFEQWLDNTIGSRSEELFASFKADGGSYSFEYHNGKLIYAVSRGDGTEGEDITANALKFRDLPKFASYKNKPYTGFVRGEVILDNDSWETVDPEMLTNPRNMGVGIASRKDGAQCELLRVLIFRVYDKDGELLGKTEEEHQDIIKSMGFKPIEHTKGNYKDIWKFYEETNKKRASIPYWIDGIVVKVNDLDKQAQLGDTTHHPKGQIALKFPAEKKTSVLRNVRLQVGHTGAICPVGEFDPIKLGGATVSNATLHNWDYINSLDVAVGDTIEVIKAGDIIPKIISAPIKAANRVLIKEPSVCPICGHTAVRKKNINQSSSTAIYCFNTDCSSKQIGKITKFVDSLNILGAGDVVIESLLKEKYIEDAADLFSLKLHANSLPDLLLSGKTRFGEKRVEQLLEEIESKREIDLATFLGALGIAGLGKRRVEQVQEAAPNEFNLLEDWISDKLVDKAYEVGMPNIAYRIHTDIMSMRNYIGKFIKNGLIIKAPFKISSHQKRLTFNGKFVDSVCITGKLEKERSYYENLIRKAGIEYHTSVKSTTTHLCVSDISAPDTTKTKKAREKGTNIIGEKELLTILDAQDMFNL